MKIALVSRIEVSSSPLVASTSRRTSRVAVVVTLPIDNRDGKGDAVGLLFACPGEGPAFFTDHVDARGGVHYEELHRVLDLLKPAS